VVGNAFTDAGGVSGLVHYALTRCSGGRGAHCITTQYDYSAQLGTCSGIDRPRLQVHHSTRSALRRRNQDRLRR